MSGFGKTPSFSYPGGKVGLREWLISMMPKSGRTYCEPFAGRGNVFWLAARCLRFESWWLNDIWTKPFFDAILEADFSELPIRLTKNHIKESAARVIAGDATMLDLILSPRTMFSGGCDHSCSTKMLTRWSMKAYRNHLEAARLILSRRNTRLTDWSWEDVLKELKASDFAYLNPPYMNNNAGYCVDAVDHNKLMRSLAGTGCRWLLSGKDTELYRSMLGKPFAQRDIRIKMNAGGLRVGANTRVMTECVWRNY